MLAGDVPGGMRQIILAAVLVLAAVAGPVAADEHGEYTPPGDRSIDELADAYNANLDVVPWWLRGALPKYGGAEVVVIVFADASMDAEGGSDWFELQVGEGGMVDDVVDLDTERVRLRGNRIIISTTADTMDAIITADDPAATAQTAYVEGALRVESEGDFARGVVFWMVGLFDFLIY